MKFGIYVHIPYCLQRCSYCDFATYVHSEILAPPDYVRLVKKEITLRGPWVGPRPLDTLYFGGGTPSLLPPQQIAEIIQALSAAGFPLRPKAEVTIEINPATITEERMQIYLSAGINRFSVGAQTFDDRLLKFVRREHTADQTRSTLELLKSFNVNYSFDLLFALPGQNLAGLKKDLEEVARFKPPHISPYCLTVPESHPLSQNRPEEDQQVAMFDLISDFLTSVGYEQYEISNFAKTGFESKHNSLYWDNDEYWGIGLSSHSYLKQGPWGMRFWNPRAINDYTNWVQNSDTTKDPKPEAALREELLLHQALTDYCHISLRRAQGLSTRDMTHAFGSVVPEKITPLLQSLALKKLVFQRTEDQWSLTKEGILLSNQVFSQLTFLPEDLSPRIP